MRSANHTQSHLGDLRAFCGGIRRGLRGIAAAALSAVALAACASAPTASPSVTSGSPVVMPAPIDPATVVVSTDGWSYAGRPGRAIQTANYRFYTTEESPALIGRLPVFMETALSTYRTSFAGLPAPPGKLDTFLMATRGQWELLTRQLMGENAPVYLRIQRGGYASGGRGVFYDIGTADTLSIAGHEGWHQYTQRTFREPLPIWLEEGIATTMEGHRWEGPTPTLLPWSNPERFDQLRTAASKNALMPLIDIFQASPQELLAPASINDPPEVARSRGTSEAALTYYAQIWALVHFLREGENGKYRDSLIRLVNDAARGREGSTLSRTLGSRAARSALATRKGPAVAMAYFNKDLDQLAQEYARFVEIVVRPGSRGPAIQGRSPIGMN